MNIELFKSISLKHKLYIKIKYRKIVGIFDYNKMPMHNNKILGLLNNKILRNENE